MIRIKNFFTWLRGGTFLTSGPRNTLIAAHAATRFAPGGSGNRGDGGTVFMDNATSAPAEETAEERSRRLKRERDRRYKANKKAKQGGFSLPVQTALA